MYVFFPGPVPDMRYKDGKESSPTFRQFTVQWSIQKGRETIKVQGDTWYDEGKHRGYGS